METTEETATVATVVLIHGAWHGAWCWDHVVALLEGADVPAIAVDLPGHGASAEPLGDLYTHTAFVRALLEQIDGPIVLCGHSYGGAVISEAAAGVDGVRHLVYLCALVPDVGETLGTVMADTVTPEQGRSELGSAMQVHDDGTMTLDVEASVPVFYADCSDADVDAARKQLGAHSAAGFGQPLRAAAWHDTPSTYIVCTEDRAINPEFQRAMGARTTSSVEWATSHSPFFSRPDLVADLLARRARDVATAES
jgi:pimeloyl-ACP methyl ester carboxylesterase